MKKGSQVTLKIEVEDLNSLMEDAGTNTVLLVFQENEKLDKSLKVLYPGKLMSSDERRLAQETRGVYVTAGLIKTPQKSQMKFPPKSRLYKT